jgi:hypothetical protein
MMSDEHLKILESLVASHVAPEHFRETVNVLWDIRIFVVKECQKYKQLPPHYDLSPETWVEKTTYTRKEKDGFLRELFEQGFLTKLDRACKCFIKAETYPEYKHTRPIKSRTDRFKVYMGPAFQGINEILFSDLESFIKKIPVWQRPEFLMNKLKEFIKINCTDYSSFEAHFIDMVMFTIEYPFYCWCTWLLPIADDFRDELATLMKRNVCKFYDFIVDCMSRASGEMNTSSGNGWVNMILFKYVSQVKQSTSMTASFEGDDGVTANIPESSAPTTEDYFSLGWTCKMVTVEKFEEASFCGIVADSEELINVCDVRAYIGDFGWTRQQYMEANKITLLALLRAKGYSAVYQYKGCPILDALGHYALRVTDYTVVNKKMMRMYKRGQLADSRFKNKKFEEILKFFEHKRPERHNTPHNTRELVAKLYGISIDQQINIENYLDALNEIVNLDIDIDVPEQWRYNTEMFNTHEYIHEVSSHMEQLDRDLRTIL